MRIRSIKLRVAGIAAAVMASVLPASSAFAMPTYAVFTFYYYDAAMTEEAGIEILSCSGNHTMGGTVTPYAIVEYDSCGNGSGPHDG